MSPTRTIALILAITLAGCSGSSGGSGGAAKAGATGGASTKTGPTGATQGAASAQHWATALAALGASYQPATPTVDAAGLAHWNALMARGWPGLRQMIDPYLEAAIRQAIASAAANMGTVRIQGIRSLSIDTSAPPGFSGAVGPNGTQQFILNAPAAPGAWSVSLTLDVGATLQQTIFGVPVAVGVTLDVTALITNGRATETFDIDVTRPERPVLVGAGRPQIAFDVAVQSQDPLLAQLAGSISAIIDPIVRGGLQAGAIYAEQQILGFIRNIPAAPWGLGVASAQLPAQLAFLRRLAEETSDEVQRHHLPFGTLLPVIFDQPGYGNGVPVRYQDYGDSACWTGHYVASECLRWEMTGDARALAGAQRAIDGLEGCLEIGLPGGGRLVRCLIPTSHPAINDIKHSSEYVRGFHRGVEYGGLGEISRDQYIGTMLGLTQAYLRVPALRDQARRLVGRVVAQLDAQDWIAYFMNSPQVSAPFVQTPSVFWAFVRAGNITDRARFGALHDAHRDISSVIWIADFLSTREVMEAYYKFNLLHSTKTILVTTESDPGRYRDYLKALEIAHDVVGHHQNAWFDAVYGVAIPSWAPAMGLQVEAELQHWALRDRRGRLIRNSLDPTIPKAIYGSPLMTSPTPQLVATEPVPVEKRPCGDFIWQTSPFELDGTGNQAQPTVQQAGVDLMLPYWIGRSYGLLR